MAARRDRQPVGPAAPLDLDAARAALASGRPVRVTLGPGSGLPEDTRGTVVRIEDAATHPECVVVRVGGDELPFAPSEVALGAARRPREVLSLTPADQAPPTTSGPSPHDLAAAAAYELPAATPPRRSAVPVADPGPGAAERAGEGERRAPAPKRGGRRPSPRLEVTLRYAEGGWTVTASSGARTLLRPQPLDPGAAVALTAVLDTPAVSALVGEIVDKGRQEASARVEALAQQLAAAEAELQSYATARPGRPST